MAKVLISIEISKPYAHWKNVFDSLESEGQKTGIKKIYVSHEAGLIRESSKITFCSD